MENSIMANLDDLIIAQSGISNNQLKNNAGITGTGLGITPASLGVQTGTDTLFREVTDASRFPYHIPTIYTMNNRNPTWSGAWQNADGWGNYYNYMNSDTDRERNFHMAMGRHNRQMTTSYSSVEQRAHNVIQWAKGNVVGGGQVHNEMEDSGYQGFSMRTMFIRNFSASAITSTIYGWYSVYWLQGYEGASMYLVTPNNSSGTNYSTVNGVTFTNLTQSTGTSTNTTWSANFTVPAGKTVALVQSANNYWWQGGYGGKALEVNKFYNLDTTFANKALQPDMRMTQTAHNYADLDDSTYNGYSSYRLWNRCATIYGDR